MTTGVALSGAGLALALVGYHPVARLTGLGAFYVGIPLMGLGAGHIGRSAEGLDSGYHRSSRGWGWFWTGMALGAFGVNSLAESQGESPGDVFGGAAMVIASMGCEAVAGARFWGEAKSGRRILAAGSDVSLWPILIFPEGGSLPAPGIRIAYPF
jgi:hypothetical protein